MCMTTELGLVAGHGEQRTTRRWVDFIYDHNPCFLLSALLMFVGVFLLNTARSTYTADMGSLLAVLAAVNVYEFAILGLAVVLLRRMGVEKSYRDPWLLMLIQLLFLIDGGFLLSEAVQTSPSWGWVVNVVLFGLASLKVWMVMVGAKLPVRWRTMGFLLVQLGIMYGLPIVLSRVAVDGEVSERAMYGVWWVVGLLPVAYDLIAGKEVMTLTGRQQVLRRSYVIAPWLMLIAHLGYYHYVYEAPFTAACLSPVMLGLAVATRRVGASAFATEGNWRFMRAALPVVAVLMAMMRMEDAAVPSVQVTLAASVVVCGYFVSLSVAGWAVVLVGVVAAGRAVWPTVVDVAGRGRAVGESSLRGLVGLLPTTTLGWGVVAMIGAFVLLGVGAMMSLRRVKGKGRDS